MTIKELCNIVAEDHKVSLGYNGVSIPFLHTDPFQLNAYGDYEIQDIFSLGEKKLEINVKMQPVKRDR